MQPHVSNIQAFPEPACLFSRRLSAGVEHVEFGQYSSLRVFDTSLAARPWCIRPPSAEDVACTRSPTQTRTSQLHSDRSSSLGRRAACIPEKCAGAFGASLVCARYASEGLVFMLISTSILGYEPSHCNRAMWPCDNSLATYDRFRRKGFRDSDLRGLDLGETYDRHIIGLRQLRVLTFQPIVPDPARQVAGF